MDVALAVAVVLLLATAGGRVTLLAIARKVSLAQAAILLIVACVPAMFSAFYLLARFTSPEGRFTLPEGESPIGTFQNLLHERALSVVVWSLLPAGIQLIAILSRLVIVPRKYAWASIVISDLLLLAGVAILAQWVRGGF